MSPARRRIVYAAIVALVAFAAPLLLGWFGSRGPGGMSSTPLLVAPLIGPMVFQLLAHPRPEWWHGLAFAVVPALVGSIWVGVGISTAYGSRLAGGVCVYIFFVAYILGMVGALVASLVVRLLDRKPKDQTSRKLRPWHVGATLAFLAVIAVAVVAALTDWSEVIPSALDDQAVDVKAEPGPAELPSRVAGVLADSLLEMTGWIARSNEPELHRQRWWDSVSERHRSVALHNEWVSDSSQTETEKEWGTHDIVYLGQQLLDGNEVDVYRVDLNIGRGQERSADFGLIFVDSETGLRQREEWLIGSPGDAWVRFLHEYRLVPRTPELEKLFY